MMEAIKETIEIGKQSVEDAEIRMLAVVYFFDQLFQAVKYRAEVFVLALDNRYCVHSYSWGSLNKREF
jgi:CO dehydrogenase/acetyl-CoA synthase epsilon subunit